MRPLRYASDGQMPARSSIGYDRVVGEHNGVVHLPQRMSWLKSPTPATVQSVQTGLVSCADVTVDPFTSQIASWPEVLRHKMSLCRSPSKSPDSPWGPAGRR